MPSINEFWLSQRALCLFPSLHKCTCTPSLLHVESVVMSDIWINVNTDDWLTGNTEGAGLKVIVHDPHLPPTTDEQSVAIPPGTETFLSIEKNVIRSLPKPYSDVDCVEDVGGYRYKGGLQSDIYSYEGCMVDCMTEKTAQPCNCTFDHDNSTGCTLDEFVFCLLARYGSHYMECNNCLHPCEVTQYKAERAWMSLPGASLLHQHNISRQSSGAQYIRDNYILLHVYFPSLHYTVTEQVEAFTFDELISNLGGQLGLFLGASLMTMVELLEGLALIGHAWYKRKMANQSSIRPQKKY